MSFDQLGLSPELLRAVADQGYTEPTPVQAAAIPLVLAGRDVLAGAQTGTGKTAAFVLPIIQLLGTAAPVGERQAPTTDRRVPATDRRGPIRVLVVVPTRELALQVEESVRTYGARHRFRSTTIYGGVGFDPQVRALRAGPEIVVATPGRLLDHVGQRTIDLSRVEILVLDEADRMLDMGFIRDIRKILALLPAKRQNLLFSATFSDEIRRLADGFLDRPASVEVARRNTPAELVRQVVHPVDRERKRELLSRLIRTGAIRQALVFTRTKHGASRLSEQLARDGIAAAAIHGNKSQPQRVRALNDFKAGRVDILVATDIAARGLDIEALPHVVNYELPMVPEDYVHRIGRTGRAGVDGIALSLVCVDEAKLLRDIEGMLGRRVETQEVPGFTPDLTIRPEPIRLRSGEPGHGGFGGTVRPAGRGVSARPAQGRPIAGGRVPVGGGRSPVSAPARMSIGRPMPARPVAAGRPAPARPSMGRHDPRHDLRIDPRLAGTVRPDVPVERPPWARDAGRVNGERIALPRTMPGERLARLPQE
jgi:ATP-dependent RNA helicase RhlE